MFCRTATAARLLISAQRPAANHQIRYLNVASRPSDLVGNTPLIDLNKILVAHGVDGETFASSVWERCKIRVNY